MPLNGRRNLLTETELAFELKEFLEEKLAQRGHGVSGGCGRRVLRNMSLEEMLAGLRRVRYSSSGFSAANGCGGGKFAGMPLNGRRNLFGMSPEQRAAYCQQYPSSVQCSSTE